MRTACLYGIFAFCLIPLNAVCQEIGSEDWHFEMSKSIALELADSQAWSLSSPYLRDLSSRSQDWNLWLLRAKVELQQGNVDAAREVVDYALSLYPSNPRILAMAGHVASDAGDTEKATVYYTRVLELQPYNVQVLKAFARLKYAAKDWEAALELYERLEDQISLSGEALVRMATACENLGDYECAEGYLLDNVETHPNRLMALLPLEHYYRRRGNISRANEISAERNRLQKRVDPDERILRALPKSVR